MMARSTRAANASIVTVGSDLQSAHEQANVLKRDPAFCTIDVVSVTAGTRGFLTALATPSHRWIQSEVADVYGRPHTLAWLLDPVGTAIIDAAQLATPNPHGADQNIRDVATTYGIGQLIERARQMGASRIVVGADGFPGADAASGAANAAGASLVVTDGSGLKVGANELANLTGITVDQLIRPRALVVMCDTKQSLSQITTPKEPQRQFAKQVAPLNPQLTPDTPYTGAYEGLAFGLAALFGATLVDAPTFGVQLHDTSRTASRSQLLIGSNAQLTRFAPAYRSSQQQTATLACDMIDANSMHAITGAYAQLQR